MKIVCSKENLLRGLDIAMRAVPVRTTMTILECILIDAQASRIRLVSNDMEMGIETFVDGDILEKGIAALDAKILYEIVRKLPENDITIRIDENYSAVITCEKSRFQIPAQPGDDFTVPPMVEKNSLLTDRKSVV